LDENDPPVEFGSDGTIVPYLVKNKIVEISLSILVFSYLFEMILWVKRYAVDQETRVDA
jgi:hypothetical protein